MQSFRVLRIPYKAWEHDGTEFSEALDLFHLPFPSLRDGSFHHSYVETLEERRRDAGSSWSGLGQSLGPEFIAGDPSHMRNVPIFSRLPAELTDEIFRSLSIPALDAARFTCKAWWNRILVPDVLSAVLGKSIKVGSRDLSLAFEEAARLPAAHSHPDSWRTRFVIRDVTLRAPSLAASLPGYAIEAVSLTLHGHFIIVRVADSTVSDINISPSPVFRPAANIEDMKTI